VRSSSIFLRHSFLHARPVRCGWAQPFLSIPMGVKAVEAPCFCPEGKSGPGSSSLCLCGCFKLFPSSPLLNALSFRLCRSHEAVHCPGIFSSIIVVFFPSTSNLISFFLKKPSVPFAGTIGWFCRCGRQAFSLVTRSWTSTPDGSSRHTPVAKSIFRCFSGLAAVDLSTPTFLLLPTTRVDDPFFDPPPEVRRGVFVSIGRREDCLLSSRVSLRRSRPFPFVVRSFSFFFRKGKLCLEFGQPSCGIVDRTFSPFGELALLLRLCLRTLPE